MDVLSKTLPGFMGIPFDHNNIVDRLQKIHGVHEQQNPKSTEIVLDRQTLLSIELAVTKLELAQTRLRLAKLSVQEAEQECVAAKAAEQELRRKIEQQVGHPVIGDIRLVDKEKGLCQVG